MLRMEEKGRNYVNCVRKYLFINVLRMNERIPATMGSKSKVAYGDLM